MPKNLPSVKTLSRITDAPKILRKVLETTDWTALSALLDGDGFPGTKQWERQCHCQPGFHHTKMNMADELCRTHGVEGQRRGHNAKSPGFDYLNAGDAYAETLIYVQGRYRVGCWADIVERGSYD